MVRRLGSLLLVFAALATLPACGKKHVWQVVTQAPGNSLAGKRDFVVAPVEYKALTVGEKAEAAYLAEKEQETRDSWERDKQMLSRTFGDELGVQAAQRGLKVATGAQGPLLIKPEIAWLEPGYYVGLS